eukprot:CAMPEP_0182914142 /NCGR_PEP_ID=MMETSP0034_2-20130328/38403_1 /TAXON_ID=156128 /ORGANISM="Nephroselmis pyriformis, Strain CCMP717" /LENGTH=163 /DNA_ID=CAMNT_0025050891 /DNA_START=39 /DNA_END=530 /DNA_ORIENTATION=+
MSEEHIDTTFESTDAGASTTYPSEAGQVRKGGFMVIKGRPCKVLDVSTSKTGKHGHAKCNFTTVDIFTGKKLEDMQPSTHNIECPNVTRQEYTLLDITDDGYLSLMSEDGGMREDLLLRSGCNEEIADSIQAQFDDGKELVVTVLKAMNEEMVNAVKESAGGK